MTETVFPAGKSGNPRGRPKGSKSKIPQAVKEALLGAFHEVGGQAYLMKVALDDPKTFCALVGKLIPSEIKHEGAGENGEHIHRIERAVVYPKGQEPT